MSVEQEARQEVPAAHLEAYDSLLDLASRLDLHHGDLLSTTLARLLRATAVAVSLGSLEALMAGTRAVGRALERHGAGDGEPH